LTSNSPTEQLLTWSYQADFISLKCPQCGKWLHGASEGEALASLAGHVNMSHGKKLYP